MTFGRVDKALVKVDSIDSMSDTMSNTIPALLDSDELMFVVRGEEKRALLEAAARGENDLPAARLLGAARQPVTCFT